MTRVVTKGRKPLPVEYPHFLHDEGGKERLPYSYKDQSCSEGFFADQVVSLPLLSYWQSVSRGVSTIVRVTRMMKKGCIPIRRRMCTKTHCTMFWWASTSPSQVSLSREMSVKSAALSASINSVACPIAYRICFPNKARTVARASI